MLAEFLEKERMLTFGALPGEVQIFISRIKCRWAVSAAMENFSSSNVGHEIHIVP